MKNPCATCNKPGRLVYQIPLRTMMPPTVFRFYLCPGHIVAWNKKGKRIGETPVAILKELPDEEVLRQ